MKKMRRGMLVLASLLVATGAFAEKENSSSNGGYYHLKHKNGGEAYVLKKEADLDELKKKGFICVGEVDKKPTPAKTEITRDGEVLYKHDGPTLEK